MNGTFFQQTFQSVGHLPTERSTCVRHSPADAFEAKDEPEDVRADRHAHGSRGGTLRKEAFPDQHAAAQSHPHAERSLLHAGVLQSRKVAKRFSLGH